MGTPLLPRYFDRSGYIGLSTVASRKSFVCEALGQPESSIANRNRKRLQVTDGEIGHIALMGHGGKYELFSDEEASIPFTGFVPEQWQARGAARRCAVAAAFGDGS